MGKKILNALVTVAALGYFVYANFFAFGSKMEFGTGEVYYKGDITETDARRLGESLQVLGYFDGQEASVQLVKDEETYVVRFVTVDSAWTDQEMKDAFSYLGGAVNQSAFPGKNVRIELCDTSFDTEVTLQPKAAPEEPAVEEAAAEEATAEEAPAE